MTDFTATADGIRVTAMWSGSGHGAHDAVETYGELGTPSAASLGDVTFLELQSRSDDHFAWGRRYYAKGGFFKTISADAISLITASVAEAPTADCEIYVLQLGGAVSEVHDDPPRTPGARPGSTGSSSPSGTTRPMTLAASPGAAEPQHSCQPCR